MNTFLYVFKYDDTERIKNVELLYLLMDGKCANICFKFLKVIIQVQYNNTEESVYIAI